MPFHVRPVEPNDLDFILSLTPRFSEFELPWWRDKDAMDRANREHLLAELENPSEGAAAFIAEDEAGVPVGLVYLKPKTDAFDGTCWGEVWLIAVAPAAEGRGVGALLLSSAEQWARSQRYRGLKLQAFADNDRARRVYEREGFTADSIAYVKPF